MVRAYYKAEKYRQQKVNIDAWLYGAYVARAIDATVGNMFRKEGSDMAEYPRDPIPYGNEEQPKTEVQEEQEKAFAYAYMSNMVLLGKNWGKNKGVCQ